MMYALLLLVILSSHVAFGSAMPRSSPYKEGEEDPWVRWPLTCHPPHVSKWRPRPSLTWPSGGPKVSLRHVGFRESGQTRMRWRGPRGGSHPLQTRFPHGKLWVGGCFSSKDERLRMPRQLTKIDKFSFIENLAFVIRTKCQLGCMDRKPTLLFCWGPINHD